MANSPNYYVNNKKLEKTCKKNKVDYICYICYIHYIDNNIKIRKTVK